MSKITVSVFEMENGSSVKIAFIHILLLLLPLEKKGLTNNTFWSDFRRIGGTWISQEKGYGMGETNWAGGQPDNAGGNQGCVSINPSAQKWYDNNCSNMYSVACVKDESATNNCCNKSDPCKKPC